jgi:hypothetical protein
MRPEASIAAVIFTPVWVMLVARSEVPGYILGIA